ncbi:tetratricopeptide repeat-containing sensor histidine kinase [Fulvivirga lutea]|uniref:histidine kinase n=1 Tax=Fulvivirga lutea TaxID=2810512 RepID=A0A974WF20_9BACT|nr:tetratricopeptide repeat-containing sensor histidine kinase [Fulvivirga lutea]QSE95872.1 tetratricopeptide repeat-containing sensor histidine kinase [Fulvivirga lutea]
MKKLIYYILWFSLCFNCEFLQANKLDSLKNALATAESDSAKSYILIDLAKRVYASDLDQARDYCLQALDVSVASGQMNPFANAHNILGLYHESKSNFTKAHEYLTSGVVVAQEIGDSLLVSKFYNNLGLVYKNTGRLQLAVEYYIKSQKIAEQYGTSVDEAASFNNLAIVYKLLGDYSYSRVYTRKAYDIFKQDGDSVGMSAALNNLGLNFKDSKSYDSALFYLRQSLDIKEAINYKKGVVSSLYNIGELYLEVGLVNESLEYFDRSLKLAREEGIKRHIAKAYHHKANALLQLNRIDDAIENYEQSLKINHEVGVPIETKEDYKMLAESYEIKGDFNQAYSYLSKALAIEDSLFDSQMGEAVTKLRFEYDLDAKNREIENLRSKEAQSQLQLEKDRLIYYFSSAAILFMVILTVILYQSNKRQRKANIKIDIQKDELERAHSLISQKNEQLASQNRDLEEEVKLRTEELDKLLKEFDLFVYKSAHDLRNPVAQILGIYNLLKIDKDNPELLDKLKNTAELMDRLLSKLSTIHIIRNKEIDYRWVSIEKLVHQLMEKHESDNALTNIKMQVINSDDVQFKSDKEMMLNLLDELISNSIKYRNENAKLKVTIALELSAEGVRLLFSDNGTGIEIEHQPSVFDMFYRANAASKGHGLGLYQVLVIVRKLNGKIELVKSDKNGTQFEILLETETKSNTKVSDIDQF